MMRPGAEAEALEAFVAGYENSKSPAQARAAANDLGGALVDWVQAGQSLGPYIASLLRVLPVAVSNGQAEHARNPDLDVPPSAELAYDICKALLAAVKDGADISKGFRLLEILMEHPVYGSFAAEVITEWMARQSDWDGLELLAGSTEKAVSDAAKAVLSRRKKKRRKGPGKSRREE
jgi:hypothetical protein